MTTRGDRTREQLLDVAEQLYGRDGVDRVSLREIRLAAGQRNKSAMQFHFGDRDGLLRALADRHLPRQAAIQNGLYDAMVAEHRQDDPRSLVDVLFRPNARYVALGASERAWIKIAAELAARPELALRELRDNASQSALAAGGALYERLTAQLPTEVAIERLMAVSRATLHICADRARVEDAGGEAGDANAGRLDLESWADNLIDMACGALFAPARTPHIA
jgi:AcrR family transcriptional regulator